MDIRNFITFNTVVEVDGFTKAANRLSYAQSTVTLHIKELEKFYETPLFDRMGKKIFLTEFGKVLYKKSSMLVNAYDEILDLKVSGDQREVLRIGVYESLLRYRIYDLIHEFKINNPNVDLIIQHGTCRTLRNLVREGELDLTFQIEPLRNFADLKTRVLCEEKFSLIFPEDSGIECIHKNHQTIYLTEKDCSYRLLFEQFLNEEGVNKQHVMETGSVDLIKQYVSIGLGFSMVPSVTVEREKDRAGLNVQDFSGQDPMYTQLVHHKDKHVFRAMDHFIKLVQSYSASW